jgi:hypothetical protein
MIWAAVFAAVFALAAYNQAAEPASRLWLGALVVIVLAYGYLAYAMPADLSFSDAAFDRHPDGLKFQAASYVMVAAAFCFLGTLIGSLFRKRASAGKIGGYTFVAAFFGLQVAAFSMAAKA